MNAQHAYEVHPPTLAEFLDMLSERENDTSLETPIRGPRAWVYLTALIQTRNDSSGILYAHRWVQAQMVYGSDLITWKLTTSNTIEMNMPGDDHAARQETALEEARAKVTQKMEELGMEASDLRETYLTRGDTNT